MRPTPRPLLVPLLAAGAAIVFLVAPVPGLALAAATGATGGVCAYARRRRRREPAA